MYHFHICQCVYIASVCYHDVTTAFPDPLKDLLVDSDSALTSWQQATSADSLHRDSHLVLDEDTQFLDADG